MNQTDEILAKMEEDIRLRGYSWHTQDYYLRYARQFLMFADRQADELSDSDIREYLKYLLAQGNLAKGTVNAHNAAVRFLFEVTLNQRINFKQIPRLREKHSIPVIFTKEELRRLFEQVSPLRNKAMLMTIYGGGLRVSEVCKLRVADIDSRSMRIFVSDGKGLKDRYTLLSQANLDILRDYFREYRPSHPSGWLFLGQKGTGHANVRTVQTAFNKALLTSKIGKDATLHSLRASFATHLFEAGTDVFTVKQLLGHSDLSSISRYIAAAAFQPTLKSPLDSLPKKRGRKPKASATGAAHA